MIGFDRPLKPRWIYELLNLVEDGKKSTIYNIPFENIASELIGKEGKRKVRTIIFRTFIYSFQEKKRIVKNNYLIELSKSKTLEYMKPIYLMKLIFDYEIIQNFLGYLNSIFDEEHIISTDILRKKFVNDYGDRDLSKRSLRAFLKTLSSFGILIQTKEKKTFEIYKKSAVSKEQLKDILLVYSDSILKSKFIDLQNINQTFFSLYSFPDFLETAQKFNNINWEFIRANNRNSLLIK